MPYVDGQRPVSHKTRLTPNAINKINQVSVGLHQVIHDDARVESDGVLAIQRRQFLEIFGIEPGTEMAVLRRRNDGGVRFEWHEAGKGAIVAIHEPAPETHCLVVRIQCPTQNTCVCLERHAIPCYQSRE